MTDAFWIDTREEARFGGYIENRGLLFVDAWAGDSASWRVDHAVLAWQTATSPVMSSPYVRTHPRVLDSTLARNHWTGTLTAAVDLAADLPASLTNERDLCRGWRGWPTHRIAGEVHPETPEPDTIEPVEPGYLTTTLRITLPLSDDELPDALPASRPYARTAVQVLVDQLNKAIAPLLVPIEGGY